MDPTIFGPFVQIFSILKFVFTNLWQYIVPPFVFIIAFISWVYYRQGQYIASLKFILLNIRVPQENLRSPYAMELVIAGLYGIFNPRDPVEKYWRGELQEWISLEIVGIDGHVNFVIWSPIQFQDLIEAHVYAQYPEAEIVQVADYASEITAPVTTPESEWDLWGGELVLTKEDVYPIRTYVDFEIATQSGPDEAKVDPISSIIEAMGRLGPGEQIWVQIPILPADVGWRENGLKLVKKLIGVKEPGKNKSFFQNFFDEWVDFAIKAVTEAPFRPPTFAGAVVKEEKNSLPSLMQFLSPGEQDAVKALERNISKVAFSTKIRIIYLMQKSIFDKNLMKSRVLSLTAAYGQFTSTNLNSFKLTRKTSAHYWFPTRRLNHRKEEILREYKKRSLSDGTTYYLNIEELATLFHFPTNMVKTPLMERIEVKKSMPPKDLPMI